MKANTLFITSALFFISTVGSYAACQSAINGGTTLAEGACYKHSNGHAVGCHGGNIGVVTGTTNKCTSWVDVVRNMSTNPSGTKPSSGKLIFEDAIASGSKDVKSRIKQN